MLRVCQNPKAQDRAKRQNEPPNLKSNRLFSCSLSAECWTPCHSPPFQVVDHSRDRLDPRLPSAERHEFDVHCSEQHIFSKHWFTVWRQSSFKKRTRWAWTCQLNHSSRTWPRQILWLSHSKVLAWNATSPAVRLTWSWRLPQGTARYATPTATQSTGKMRVDEHHIFTRSQKWAAPTQHDSFASLLFYCFSEAQKDALLHTIIVVFHILWSCGWKGPELITKIR
jgi:hypothetical protein